MPPQWPSAVFRATCHPALCSFQDLLFLDLIYCFLQVLETNSSLREVKQELVSSLVSFVRSEETLLNHWEYLLQEETYTLSPATLELHETSK